MYFISQSLIQNGGQLHCYIFQVTNKDLPLHLEVRILEPEAMTHQCSPQEYKYQYNCTTLINIPTSVIHCFIFASISIYFMFICFKFSCTLSSPAMHTSSYLFVASSSIDGGKIQTRPKWHFIPKSSQFHCFSVSSSSS